MRDFMGNAIAAAQNFVCAVPQSVFFITAFVLFLIGGGALDGGLPIPVFVLPVLMGVCLLVMGARKEEEDDL